MRYAECLTPLCLAAKVGDVDMMRALLAVTPLAAEISEVIAAVHSPPRSPTPLMLAAASGHLPAVHLLLAEGSAVNARAEYIAPVQLPDRTMIVHTALELAVCAGHAAVVRALIDCGAHVNPPDTLAEHLPLMRAVLFNQPSIVRILLQRGADAAVRDQDGWTLYAIAESWGHADVMSALEGSGADFDPDTDQLAETHSHQQAFGNDYSHGHDGHDHDGAFDENNPCAYPQHLEWHPDADDQWYSSPRVKQVAFTLGTELPRPILWPMNECWAPAFDGS